MDRRTPRHRPHPHRGLPRAAGRPSPPPARRHPQVAHRGPCLRSRLGPDPDVTPGPHRAPPPAHRRSRESRPPRPRRDRPRVPAAHRPHRGRARARRHRFPRLSPRLRVRERRGGDGTLVGYAVAQPGDRADRGSRPVWFAGATFAYDLSLPRVRERFTPHIAPADWALVEKRIREASALLSRAGHPPLSRSCPAWRPAAPGSAAARLHFRAGGPPADDRQRGSWGCWAAAGPLLSESARGMAGRLGVRPVVVGGSFG